MALKTEVLERSRDGTAVVISVTDELIGTSSVREVPVELCREFASELPIPDELGAAAFYETIARVISVREYLQEIGEDPDHPKLG